MNIFIVGATGRMGEEIRQLISENKRLKFVGGLGSKASGPIVSSLAKAPPVIDVVIDFSNAEVFAQTVEWCMKKKLPLVSGTTGISSDDKKLISVAARRIPILWAPSTAPGIHWVKKIFSELGLPPGFDVQIIETHHNRKKDKPSGTALFLQDAIAGLKKNVPAPLAVRGGGVFGIHRIELMANDETVTIEHHALSRTLFARGALDAAQWLEAKKPGAYTMEDFIAEKS